MIRITTNKIRALLIGFTLLGLGNNVIANNPNILSGQKGLLPEIRTINAKDTVVFDLSKAAITGNYVDIPIVILSDDTIHSFDFQMKYNPQHCTYDSIINLTSYINPSAGYDPVNLTLGFASYSLQSYTIGKPLILLRLLSTIVCGKSVISKADFTLANASLNGKSCSVKITNAALYGANFTFNNKICTGVNVTFNDASTTAAGTISSWSWNLGNGSTSSLQNPVTSYLKAGTYTVTLITTSSISSSCKDTVSKSITVGSSPVAHFTSLANCNAGSVAFTDQSTILSGTITGWLWNFGDAGSSNLQNPAHKYVSGGNYTVSLTVVSASGCSANYNDVVFLSTPTASFNASNACIGSTINFTDQSTTPSGVISSWAWSFGDGNASTLQNPAHSYAAAGTYTVGLTVVANQNCSNTISKIIVIDAKPIVKFSSKTLSGCMPLTVSFSDSSVTASGSSFFWSFGDKGTSASVNPTHTYTASGVYTVRHYVTAPSGCMDSLIRSSYIIVYDSPIAGFSSASGCLGSTTNFTDNSSTSSGTITGWNWNLGDGTLSTVQNPVHSYTAAGAYSVSLTISNQNCSNTILKVIKIDARPIVKFSSDKLSGCMPLTVNFSDSSATGPGSSFHWNFGDKGISSSMNASHTYTASGIYTVSHSVTAPSGCADSLIKSSYITVYNAPVAAFSALNGCLGTVTNFTDNSTLASGTITGWNWNLGDGTISTIQNPAHTYTAAGTYSVSLSVNSNLGCSGNIIKIVAIESKPTVVFSADPVSGCAPLTVKFSDSSVTAPGSSFFWNFGNSNTSVLINPSYTYTAAAVYPVTHIVTTSAGCRDSVVKSSYINVHAIPTASFTATPDTAILNVPVVFTNLSSTSSTWLWDFGDGGSSTVSSPMHIYTTAGTYTVCLDAYNSFACLGSICGEVRVNAAENPVGVPTGFTPNGDNNNDILFVRGGPMQEMQWKIFNEWGTVIFQTDSQKSGWDGKYKDTPQPEGVFLYTLKGTTKDKIAIDMHGIVNLMR